MKTSIAFVALAAGFAVAQDIGSLPPCGQTCIGNMVNIAQTQFGCRSGDIACYCSEQNFGYGVRDCSNQACTSADDANRVIQFGNQYCQSFFSAVSSSVPSTGAVPVLTSALASASATASATATADESAASEASSAAASASDAAESALSSVSASLSSVLSSISASASRVASSTASATAPAQTGAAPRMTALPLAGAAGMAALFFL